MIDDDYRGEEVGMRLAKMEGAGEELHIHEYALLCFVEGVKCGPLSNHFAPLISE